MTQLDAILGLVAFCFVTSVTPGPNNMMLLTSGTRFGFSRTVPHILGIVFGIAIMVACVSLGLAGLFLAHPRMKRALMLVSFAWIVWLAWKLARSSTALKPEADAVPTDGRPMSFFSAAAFQWVNPKAWAMVLGALGAWGSVPGMVGVTVAFALMGFPAMSLWAAAGQAMRKWLARPGRMKVFNFVMAVLLIASMLPVLRT